MKSVFQPVFTGCSAIILQNNFAYSLSRIEKGYHLTKVRRVRKFQAEESSVCNGWRIRHCTLERVWKFVFEACASRRQHKAWGVSPRQRPGQAPQPAQAGGRPASASDSAIALARLRGLGGLLADRSWGYGARLHPGFRLSPAHAGSDEFPNTLL